MIVLGKKYKDEFSGFEGMATARTEYLYGCVRVCLESKELKKEDGAPKEVWFDEQRLIAKVVKSRGHRGPSGGPGGPVASQRSVPSKR